MKTRTMKMVLAAAVLLVVIVSGASAVAQIPNRELSFSALGWDVSAYVKAQGIDPKYVDLSPDKVPADQEAKIAALASDEKFINLVSMRLNQLADDTVSVEIGPKVFTVVPGDSKADYTFSIQ